MEDTYNIFGNADMGGPYKRVYSTVRTEYRDDNGYYITDVEVGHFVQYITFKYIRINGVNIIDGRLMRNVFKETSVGTITLNRNLVSYQVPNNTNYYTVVYVLNLNGGDGNSLFQGLICEPGHSVLLTRDILYVFSIPLLDNGIIKVGFYNGRKELVKVEEENIDFYNPNANPRPDLDEIQKINGLYWELEPYYTYYLKNQYRYSGSGTDINALSEIGLTGTQLLYDGSMENTIINAIEVQIINQEEEEYPICYSTGIQLFKDLNYASGNVIADRISVIVRNKTNNGNTVYDGAFYMFYRISGTESMSNYQGWKTALFNFDPLANIDGFDRINYITRVIFYDVNGFPVFNFDVSLVTTTQNKLYLQIINTLNKLNFKFD